MWTRAAPRTPRAASRATWRHIGHSSRHYRRDGASQTRTYSPAISMDYLIAGKLAFVAAGAHGIGAATADLLTAEGARVIVADSDGAALAERHDRWHATIAADLSTVNGVDDAVGQVLETFGRAPDILVN